MEYHHILTKGEVKTGRLSVGKNTLNPESYTWFEKHSGERVAVYKSDNSLIKRSVIIDRHKTNSWRFSCGVDTFRDLQPGDVIIIRDRVDGNIEIDVNQPYSEIPSPTQPLLERQSSPKNPIIIPLPVPIQRQKRAILGEPLNFRGLQHAPINEQGVVFLFGMVCKELGYLVEAVQTGFPDCEGKRRLDRQRWERVRIEFEFKSSNFLKHGHNADLCDLIVCWEHDWYDCPLEVLELRKAIQALNSTQ